MANIPENTDNPILRPVTRLETTTKVFGGEYIPDDAEQRGISNLQAIELAERDQYILSRVGQPYVPASGDIPEKVGIASLDTSGKLPKAQNTSGVVFTDDTQTLKNKTIDANNNIIRCERILVSESISPTVADISKVVSYKITGDHAVIRLPTPNDLYTGLQVKISGDMANCGYVVFRDWRGGYQCISIVRAQTIYMTVIGGSWVPAQGSTFTTYADTVNNAPLNYEVPQDNPSYGQPYLVNSWKESKGIGMYSYTYDMSQGALYDVPNNSTVGVVFNKSRRGSATIIWTEAKIMEFAACIDNVWSSKYRLTDTSSAQTIINKTIDANNNTLKNVVTSKNITNCITEIPQDINLTLSSGLLVLKKDSKFYVPDGLEGSTPKFKSVTINADITLHSGTIGTSTDKYYLFLNDDLSIVHACPLVLAISGTSNPGSGYGYWYDTTNNLIKYSANLDGTFDAGKHCLPIGIYQRTSGVATAIDYVFNGVGFIGKKLFTLPGVKYLTPNGRNADGTLRSVERTVSTPWISSLETTVTVGIWLSGNSGAERVNIDSYTYDEKDNIFYVTGDRTQLRPVVRAGTITLDGSGNINGMKLYTPFHAVDYNDWANHIGSGTIHTITTFDDSSTTGTLKWCVVNRVCYISGSVRRTATGNNIVIASGLPTAEITGYGMGYNNRGMLAVEAGTINLQLNCLVANDNIFVSVSYPVKDDWVES